MKLLNKILIVVAVISISISLALVYQAYYKIVQVKESDYSFNVANHVGLVGDRDAVKFGSITPDGFGIRKIYLENTFEFPIKANIKITGEKSEWISSQDNNFILEPKTNKTVELRVDVPAYAQNHANYTGKIKVFYLRT
jgi:hypothetical protein